MSGFQSFLKLKSLQKATILWFLERSAMYNVTLILSGPAGSTASVTSVGKTQL